MLKCSTIPDRFKARRPIALIRYRQLPKLQYLFRKMKSNHYLFIGMLIVFSTLIASDEFTKSKTTIDPVPGSCTIFSASDSHSVLFGNNEDYNNSNTFYWTEPAASGNYGAVYVGFENYSYQGGINEKGLCFDANALPDSPINPHAATPSSTSL